MGFQITSVRSLDLLASQGVVDKKIMWYSQSEGVGDSAYGSGWIGSGYCQTLRIMMMRARIPNKITAAKFYAMSLESFSAVNNKMKRKCRSAVLNERFLMLTRISLCYLLRE